MRILLTGASSFTGFWFARALLDRGHELVATFTGSPNEYPEDTIRGARHHRLAPSCECVYGVRFGDPAFVNLLTRGTRFDRVCHHGAWVGDYRNPDFDVLAALELNTRSLAPVLRALAERSCETLVLTGTVFERDEGLGGSPTAPASAYGLSKSLTADLFRFHAGRFGVPLAKVVVPNPFGSFEEPRFTAYLMREWLAGRTATVRTPTYVRDNIHVALLASAYAAFTDSPNCPPYRRLAPSGYVQSQGEFTHRVAAQMRDRLSVPCAVELAEQVDFSEPRVRINDDEVDAHAHRFDEAGAWNDLAAFYRDHRQAG